MLEGFRQADPTARKRFRGIGLGMRLVTRLVDATRRHARRHEHARRRHRVHHVTFRPSRRKRKAARSTRHAAAGLKVQAIGMIGQALPPLPRLRRALPAVAARSHARVPRDRRRHHGRGDPRRLRRTSSPAMPVIRLETLRPHGTPALHTVRCGSPWRRTYRRGLERTGRDGRAVGARARTSPCATASFPGRADRRAALRRGPGAEIRGDVDRALYPGVAPERKLDAFVARSRRSCGISIRRRSRSSTTCPAIRRQRREAPRMGARAALATRRGRIFDAATRHASPPGSRGRRRSRRVHRPRPPARPRRRLIDLATVESSSPLRGRPRRSPACRAGAPGARRPQNSS